jgi:hypothetical protein
MKLQLLTSPVPCPHGYTIDMYCKWANPAHEWGKEESFYGRDRGDVFRQLREVGWVLHKDNTATCPLCRELPKEK